jgi:hypothetical protein
MSLTRLVRILLLLTLATVPGTYFVSTAANNLRQGDLAGLLLSTAGGQHFIREVSEAHLHKSETEEAHLHKSETEVCENRRIDLCFRGS